MLARLGAEHGTASAGPARCADGAPARLPFSPWRYAVVGAAVPAGCRPPRSAGDRGSLVRRPPAHPRSSGGLRSGRRRKLEYRLSACASPGTRAMSSASQRPPRLRRCGSSCAARA
jgi:hypothetical protein